MTEKTLLSIAIIVQDQRDFIESTLTSLFELEGIPYELILIDDGSTDGSTDVIESLLDYYQHEQTFYFRHEQPAGRGSSLNEALQQCTGKLFWAPETIQEIDQELLSQSLERLAYSSSPTISQKFRIPASARDWLDIFQHSQLPPDGSFIWNLPKLPSEQTFFNPYLKHYHSVELAARVIGNSFELSEASWYQPSPYFNLQQADSAIQQELLITLLRGKNLSPSVRDTMIEKLRSLKLDDISKPIQDFDHDLLNEALELEKNGRFNSALELVENVLSEEPDNSAAKQLKVRILEKKRRFVEASELKHELGKKDSKESAAEETPSPKEPPISDAEIETSLIIPTTAYGKPALEHCLLSISKHCNTDHLELIVIDNASLDDTHDYLDELREKRFLNCRVINNEQNAGFSASVNQGLKAAKGDYAFIIHNDIELKSDAIAELEELMEAHPTYAIIGPTTNKTLNPDQAANNLENVDEELIRTEYLDSFCMMLRTDTNLQFDEQYGLAFFEDIDLCFQARYKGHKVGIAPQVEVDHYFGTTTFALDLDTESEQYWKNVAYFNEKWGIEVYSEQELKSYSTFDQLLLLDDIVNPLYPEESVKNLFYDLFTDELKTEILNTSHDPETLCRLVHLFMVMDEREVMRRLEDRLEGIELPAQLIFQLVRFYFNRNIYSRCKHYLDQLKPEMDSLRADLYRLAILVENKELEEAIPKLKNLLEKTPANPLLYKLAGDIHQFEGNEDEAESFYKLAEQINPFEFSEEEKDAFGFSKKA